MQSLGTTIAHSSNIYFKNANDREVTSDFGATPAARSVLQALFTQMLMQYSRFIELIKKQGPAGLELTRDAATLPSVMYGLNALSR